MYLMAPPVSLGTFPLFLISGSLFPYVLNLLVYYSDHLLIGVVDAHYSGCLRNGRPTSRCDSDAKLLMDLSDIRWLRLRHSTLGGATEFIGLFVQSISLTPPPPSEIQRGIKHFLDAGIRPGPPPNELPALQRGHHYITNDRIIPSLYQLPVHYLSYFHRTGFGYQCLSVSELASIHGFPRYLILPNFPTQLLAFPPCQLLVACVDTVWAALGSSICEDQRVISISLPLRGSRIRKHGYPSLRNFCPMTGLIHRSSHLPRAKLTMQLRPVDFGMRAWNLYFQVVL